MILLLGQTSELIRLLSNTTATTSSSDGQALESATTPSVTLLQSQALAPVESGQEDKECDPAVFNESESTLLDTTAGNCSEAEGEPDRLGKRSCSKVLVQSQ